MKEQERKAHNIREAIKHLEFLVEVSEDPLERATHQERLEEQKQKLKQVIAAAAAASGS